ncbi:MAG: hypothetical protein JO107_02850 [Hyphomicrobiales bacterium]|nr:hypothetical protein [Hyphomicrobiales bacterium]MBV8662020.1 hypothetical protein [Hyphomicrobiales bacterium]
MTRRHAAEVYPEIILGDRGSLPLIATVSFTYSPARDATPPSYASGGDPPEAASVDDIRVESVVIDLGDNKTAPFACDPALAEWLVETLDTDELVIAAEEALDEEDAREAEYAMED